jgi:cytochrome P450
MSLVTLLLHPDQKAELMARPELMTGAVEELLRYLDPTHGGRRRVALEDVEIGGQMIRAGEAVVAHNPSADRDERVYPDPDRFDIHRRGKPHVAFGDGIHQCLGQSLARAEIEMLLNTLFVRAPQVRLAVPVEALEFSENRVVYGIKALPISW